MKNVLLQANSVSLNKQMEIIVGISSVKETVNHIRRESSTIALVPAMSALRHRFTSLIEVAIKGLDSITEKYLAVVNLKDVQCAETVNGEDQLALCFVESMGLFNRVIPN